MSVPAPGPKALVELAQAVLGGEHLGRADACYLLELDGPARHDLFYWANRIRLQFVGPRVHLCGIVSARTGHCSEDCRYCAQSAHYATPVVEQVNSPAAIVAAARQGQADGVERFGVVASGRSLSDAELERLAPALAEMARTGQPEPCVSLGCITAAQARRLAELGIRRYHHNLETSERFFPQVTTTHDYADRVATIRAARGAGLAVCSGGIIGLGEHAADRADLALALRELDVASVPLNFLHPIAGTPLADRTPPRPLEALQTIAMFRFVLPDREIRVAGGRTSCLRDLQSWMFLAGANACMIGAYLTTAGRTVTEDLQMLADLEIPGVPGPPAAADATGPA